MPDDNGITLSEAKNQLSKWLAADAAVSEGQAYTLDNGGSGGERRQLTRADAGEIRRNVEFWDSKVRQLSRGGIRVYGVIPPA
ncbi:DUF6148 family protein [Desulfobulbus elongatus]|uniref:DUF6148 family protein n=1 Tax=Desulfobulbus elongatus TaxID=53332 RepID=UPI00054EA276|nr:DUF6148 family protein [Desulfobulbus elongatus]